MTGADWEDLVQNHFDGRTSEAEAEILSSRLERDADMRLTYLRMAMIHIGLATDDVEISCPPMNTGVFGTWPIGRNVKRPTWPGLSVAALAVGVMAGVLWAFGPGVSPEAPFARLIAVSGPVQWIDHGGHAESESLIGRDVGAGTLESQSVDSWARLEYRDGTTLTLSGRAMLSLMSGSRKEIRMTHGRISVKSTSQAADEPFRIRSPAAMLELSGTQLNVDADSFSTQVFVNEGKARLIRLVDGRSTDVPSGFQAIATVDGQAGLKAVRRTRPVSVWRSQFPNGINYGEWLQGSGGWGGVRAKPLLLTCSKPFPLLIYVSSAAVAGTDAAPLVLGPEGRFVIRGRIAAPAEVFFGITVNYPNGGFAGKYVARRLIDATGEDASFEWTVACSDLVPTEPSFSAKPVGQEISECWSLTPRRDFGLVIESVELRSGD